MPLYQAVVLAVVQGLTEFLPISSTAHLALFPWLLHWQDPGLTFDVALHAGTLLAVLLFFWREWVRMLTAAFGLHKSGDSAVPADRRLFWLLVIGTIPGALAGALFEKATESKLRDPIIIALALIIVGLYMWAGDRAKYHDEVLREVTLTDSVLVGISQALALIPGVSRSGITMSTGLFRRMERQTAARFSFLLSTPLIAGAALKKGLEIRHEGLPHDTRMPFLVGIAVSAIVGYIVIGWLIRYLQQNTFKPFVIYRLVVGTAVFILAMMICRH
jgi:undecaprenyl-diphosphatase